MNENKSGLVSITFRPLDPEEIVARVAEAGLDGIEWGGDVHAPHGDIAAGERVGCLTREAGLEVLCYGSYYRVGAGPAADPSFEATLRSALAMGAPVVRVWPGKVSPDKASPEDWQRVIDDSHRIADRAGEAGLRVAYESHQGGLTETIASVRRLLASVPLPNVNTLWQPYHDLDREGNLEAIDAVLPRLEHVHVFHWRRAEGQHMERLPLAEGADRWAAYIDRTSSSGVPHAFLLEYVADDDVEQFARDADTLKVLLDPQRPEPSS